MGDFTDDTSSTDSFFEDGSTYEDTTVYDDPTVTSVTYDLDGDGLSDAIAYDSDGDGVLDTVEYDTDGDGVTDLTEWDTDGDGIADTSLASDGMGGQMLMSDTEGDGIVDTIAYDLDGDGIVDIGYRTVDGSLEIDPTVNPTDPSDPIEPVEPVVEPVDPNTATIITPGVDQGPFLTEDQPEAGDDGVHGDPRGQMDYHQMQPGPVDCLPTSVAMTISEATGIEVPADEVVAMANEHGFMGEGGMALFDAATLFENYGLDTEVTSGTADDLRAALNAGEPIIVGIDAADLYSGDAGPFDQGMVSGHAVVITGIADGPPAMVYINDPAFDDGAGLEIPLELFEDAWEDSDYSMIIAEAPAEVGAVDGTDAAAGDGATEGDGVLDKVRRVLFLPLTFTVQR